MPFLPAPTKHRWRFFRTGGLVQVSLETADDLLALGELDQKLWVALSCPVTGVDLDERTLALIDSDADGHIHVREVVAAVRWAAARLKDPAALLAPAPALPLAAIHDATPEGKTILGSALHILAALGKEGADAISVGDTTDSDRILAARAPNGDGVVTLRATQDPETQALIRDIIATMGGVPDRSGGEGVNAEKVDAFFRELASYLKWLDAAASQNLPEFGDATGPASAAVAAVRAKVDEYFARCRMAAFDPRTTAALEREETEYLAAAARDLTITASELGGLPLARIDPKGELPLLEGVNPAWREPLARLHERVVTPLFGADKASLLARDWAAIAAKLAPYQTWIGGRETSPVEKLGAARARAIVSGGARETLARLIAQDQALAPEYNAISSVARLARYYRDLRTLLHNFVSFADFYSPTRWATFQAGTLFFDNRSTRLCLRVADVNAHATLAVMSKAYVAYLDCRRAGGQTIKIAACVTQGDSDYLFVGRNGLFYDRMDRDWHATVTRIIENPISLRQAFWSPYKKLLRLVEEQVAKRAAASEAAVTTRMQTVVAPPAPGTPGTPPPPPPPRTSPAAGTVPGRLPPRLDLASIIGISVALGSVGTFLATVFAKFVDLPGWQVPLVIVALILAVSLPSVVIAWLKLRQRTIGPLLEANGWAINGRVRVNIRFGTALTERAALPPNARLPRRDPYEDTTTQRQRILLWILTVLLAAALLTAYLLRTWPFAPWTMRPPAVAVPTAPAGPISLVPPTGPG
jgi:hypothetical protein